MKESRVDKLLRVSVALALFDCRHTIQFCSNTFHLELLQGWKVQHARDVNCVPRAEALVCSENFFLLRGQLLQPCRAADSGRKPRWRLSRQKKPRDRFKKSSGAWTERGESLKRRRRKSLQRSKIATRRGTKPLLGYTVCDDLFFVAT